MNAVKQCFLHPFLTPSPTLGKQGAITYLLDKSIQNNSKLKRSYLFFGNFLKLLWNCAVYIFNAILMKAIRVWSFWFAIVRLLQRIQPSSQTTLCLILLPWWENIFPIDVTHHDTIATIKNRLLRKCWILRQAIIAIFSGPGIVAPSPPMQTNVPHLYHSLF